MTKIAAVVSMLLLVCSCNDAPKAEEASNSEAKADQSTSDSTMSNNHSPNKEAEFETDSLEISITESELGFGYIISSNEKPIIIQEHIPGVQGLQGFSDKEAAQSVAELMVHKLNHNIMPPSVTITELDSLNINYEK